MLIQSSYAEEDVAMMGERTVVQEALFYEFSLERHVPSDHLLRSIDRFVDLSGIRAHLRPFYSELGRPSIDPELMIRMLIIGYSCGIRSERRLCEEVHLNLAYRWFCRLSLDGEVPDHSTFSKNRHALLHHSDRGSQYTSEQFQGLMAENGVTCSMSRSGNVWDNAAMESFFSSLKTERVARKVYRTRDQARADVFDYIERFYNTTRRHSTIGYISPVEFEKKVGLA
jgi:transposase